MINEETYKKELLRMWDEKRRAQYKGYEGCLGVDCTECKIRKWCCSYGDSIVKAYNVFEIIDEVEKWSKEHPQKHKISKLEYDILKDCSCDQDYAFRYDSLLLSLLEKGYFKGANKDMKLKTYLDNCEVIKNEND